MQELEGVVTTTQLPPRGIFYSEGGMGKTTWASKCPNPIFVPIEEGVPKGIKAFPKTSSWKESLERISQVANGKHDYKTIVIDPLDELVNQCSKFVCDTMFGGKWQAEKGAVAFLPYDAGYKATAEVIREALNLLDKCRHRGMNVVLPMHIGLINVPTDISGVDYKKIAGNANINIWNVLRNWADLILFIDYDKRAIRGMSRDGKESKRATHTENARVFRCIGSQAYDAKCRAGYELPEILSLNTTLDEMYEMFGQGSDVLVESIHSLWQYLEPDKQPAVLKWLGITSLDDIGKVKADLLQELQNKLRAKAPKQEE